MRATTSVFHRYVSKTKDSVHDKDRHTVPTLSLLREQLEASPRTVPDQPILSISKDKVPQS